MQNINSLEELNNMYLNYQTTINSINSVALANQNLSNLMGFDFDTTPYIDAIQPLLKIYTNLITTV
ncbi:MAG: hypothetical protein K940chlam3_01426 [Chlamydiae bacterium]|nr:hypothetical protein [Chlamydiota bacterium]